MEAPDLTTEQKQHWTNFFTWLDAKLKAEEIEKAYTALCMGRNCYCFTGMLCLYYGEVTGNGKFNFALGRNCEHPFQMQGNKRGNYASMPEEVKVYFGLGWHGADIWQFYDRVLKLTYLRDTFKTIERLNDSTGLSLQEIGEIVKRDFINSSISDGSME